MLRSIICVAFLLLPSPTILRAADPESDDRLRWMSDSVGDVAFEDHADGTAISRHERSLLRWTNPVSGVKDGAVFLWTAGGRPQAAAQVFVVADGTWLQEFQSLSTAPITATKSGNAFWNPSGAGIEFESLTDAQTPRGGRAGRLVQMKRLLAEFGAKDLFEDRESYTLRLLPNPLHRYAAPEHGIIDGALFAFTHGTDPEVLILIEAAETEEGSKEAGLGWRVAFAPLTSYAVDVDRRGTTFWKCSRRPPPNRTTDSFFLHVMGKR